MNLASVAEIERLASVVLAALGRASWQAAVLAVLVLGVQWLLRGRLAARWRHNLWFLVVLRLLLPATPQSPLSLFNFAPELRPTTASIPLVTPEATLAASQSSPRADRAAAGQPPPGRPIPWPLILGALWLLGASLLLARIGWSTVRLARAVRRMRRVDEPDVLALLGRCCAEMNVRRPPQLLASPDLPAPALMGCLSPRLLLPEHVLRDFAPAELRLIVLHELAHLRRRDVAVNWLLAVLQAAHWFNPAVWLAFARLRTDRELAADELVLTAAADARERTAYGETIVKLLQTWTSSRRAGGSPAPALASLPGTVGILERAHPLRRRITMIAQFNTGFAPRWTAVAACCMLALAALTLTDAVRGQDAAPPPRPFSVAADAAPATRPLPASTATGDVAVSAGTLAVVGVDRATTGPAAAGAQRAADDAEKLYASFQKRLPELRFDAVGFYDVTSFLTDVTGLNLAVNWRVLEAAGIDRNTPVTQRLREVTIEQALRNLLRDVGGGNVKLAFSIDGGAVVISTLEELSQSPRSRAYQVDDLLAKAATTRPAREELVELIKTNVAPSQWRSDGNPGGFTITEFDNRLVIGTLDMYHLEIERLLGDLRHAKPAAAGAK